MSKPSTYPRWRDQIDLGIPQTKNGRWLFMAQEKVPADDIRFVAPGFVVYVWFKEDLRLTREGTGWQGLGQRDPGKGRSRASGEGDGSCEPEHLNNRLN